MGLRLWPCPTVSFGFLAQVIMTGFLELNFVLVHMDTKEINSVLVVNHMV